MRIRLATNADCAALPAIEQSAACAFADLGMDDVVDQPVKPAEAWEPYCESQTLWVAVDDADRPFGFLASGVQGDLLFIYELAVAYDRQRQGAGASLIATAEVAAGGLGLKSVVLTTFCDVPFNGPYYARLGYTMVEDAALPPMLQTVMTAERRRWPQPDRLRCAMRKRL